MNIKDLVANNSDKFAGITDPQKFAETLESVARDQNLNLIADDKQKPEWLPKHRFDEVNDQRNQFKAQVGELSGKLEELHKQAASLPELQKQIEDLQNRDKEWADKLASTIIHSRIREAAHNAGANDPGDILAFIDKTKLTVRDDTIEGLDVQLTALKEAKPYLFKQDDTIIVGGTKSGGNQKVTPKKGQMLTLEQIKMLTPQECIKYKDIVDASIRALGK